MVNNPAARRYLREVNMLLPGVGRQKKLLMDRIKGSVVEFLTDQPDAPYESITARLGSPNQIAASCLEEMDTDEVVNKLRSKKRIVCIVAAAALAIVLLWAGVVFAAYEEHYLQIDGQFAEEITDVTYGVVENGGE